MSALASQPVSCTVRPSLFDDPEDALWVELRFSKAPRTTADLILALMPPPPGGGLTQLLNALDRWRGAGLIEFHQQKRGAYLMTDKARRHRLPPVKDETKRGQQRNARQRIWSAIRVLKLFDLVQLCMTASVEEEAALRYVRLLERGRYLARKGRGKDAVWRLIGQAGPLHPVPSHTTGAVVALQDRNTGERVTLSARSGSPASLFLAGEINHVR